MDQEPAPAMLVTAGNVARPRHRHRHRQPVPSTVEHMVHAISMPMETNHVFVMLDTAGIVAKHHHRHRRRCVLSTVAHMAVADWVSMEARKHALVTMVTLGRIVQYRLLTTPQAASKGSIGIPRHRLALHYHRAVALAP